MPTWSQTVGATAQSETLRVTAKLVVLDATVFERAGLVVVQPLTKDDLIVEENHQPQEIRSFESIDELRAGSSASQAKTPSRTIFILDELNSASGTMTAQLFDEAYVRRELVGYLRRQPAELGEDTEVLALTHHGFAVVVARTQNRDLVIAGVQSRDPGLGSPERDRLEEFGGGGAPDYTLTKGSLAALWSLALAQRSEPGRKNVIWLGWGGPNHNTGRPRDPKNLTSGERYAREVTDLLVASRITLNVMSPGMLGGEMNPVSAAKEGGSYQFESDFGFFGFVASTGGVLKHGNDVLTEIQAAVDYESHYYTLSYRPSRNEQDGGFRRIHVSVKGHPDWTVLTKAGYYAMEFGGEKDAAHELQSDLSIAAFEAMPFDAIGASLKSVQRERGTSRVQFTVAINPADIEWHTGDSGSGRSADVAIAIAAMGTVFAKQPLHSSVAVCHLTTDSKTGEDQAHPVVTLAGLVPEKTKRLRLILRDMSNGRMGTVDVPLATIAKAPEFDPVIPALAKRPGAGSH
jgi:VWFA-related protein